jgi:hypothetical protein
MQDMRHSFDLIRRATTAHSPRVKYALHMILLKAYNLDNMPVRLIDEAEMENTRDWLSRLIEDPEGGPTRLLIAGDIPSFPHGSAHALHDGSDAAPAPARYACGLLLTVDSGNLLPGATVISRPN